MHNLLAIDQISILIHREDYSVHCICHDLLPILQFPLKVGIEMCVQCVSTRFFYWGAHLFFRSPIIKESSLVTDFSFVQTTKSLLLFLYGDATKLRALCMLRFLHTFRWTSGSAVTIRNTGFIFNQLVIVCSEG